MVGYEAFVLGVKTLLLKHEVSTWRKVKIWQEPCSEALHVYFLNENWFKQHNNAIPYLCVHRCHKIWWRRITADRQHRVRERHAVAPN
jgi:hypothetical protein